MYLSEGSSKEHPQSRHVWRPARPQTTAGGWSCHRLNSWNPKSWRCGSDDFPFQLGDFQIRVVNFSGCSSLQRTHLYRLYYTEFNHSKQQCPMIFREGCVKLYVSLYSSIACFAAKQIWGVILTSPKKKGLQNDEFSPPSCDVSIISAMLP